MKNNVRSAGCFFSSTKEKTALLMSGFIAIFAVVPGCAAKPSEALDYRGVMRSFIVSLSSYAKARNPNFFVIAQNGVELSSLSGEPSGPLARDYLNALDGQGQEDLFYGYTRDNKSTPLREQDWLLDFLRPLRAAGKTILVIDYCEDTAKLDDAYRKGAAEKFVTFGAPERELTVVPSYPPQPYGVHNSAVEKLSAVKNFLYLINPSAFSTPELFLKRLADTDYDLLIIDLFDQRNQPLDKNEVEALKKKQNGGRRLISAYLSIGEAEDYRYYWKEEWKKDPPAWLSKENPAWQGNYKVQYWEPAWQALIFSKEDSYLDRILAAGFDGVYLDIVDAFEYFEEER